MAYQRQLITRIRVMINSLSGVSLFANTPYAQLFISQRYTINMMDEPGDGVTSYTRRRHNSSSDGVTSFMTASARTDSNVDLEDSSHDGRIVPNMIKIYSNPTSVISDETIANPNAQIVRDDMVRVQVSRCMAWLDYDKHVDSLSTMDNEVGVTSPESTTQIIPSFEEYTPPVTCPKEVEKTLGTPIEVEPLNETKLEEVGLNCNHNTPFSSREVPSFDGPEPQPLLNSPSLDVSLGDVIGPEPPIKPHSLDSSRMKVVDYLTTQTPPSPHVEMFDDDWGLESKEVSPLGEELGLFDRSNEVERGRILEAYCLEPILQQQISQRIALSHHNGNFSSKTKNFFFTNCRDGVMINTRRRHHDTCDRVIKALTALNAQVIFDEKKLGDS
ncbi:hypothetical protein Tco_1570602 [Tanacetum coccineum]